MGQDLLLIELFRFFRRLTLVLYLMKENQIMTTTVTTNYWNFMPAELFDEIMFLLGSEDPGSLDL